MKETFVQWRRKRATNPNPKDPRSARYARRSLSIFAPICALFRRPAFMAAFLRSGAWKLGASAVVKRTPAAGALVKRTPAAGAFLQRTQASGAVDPRHLFLQRFMTTQERATEGPETTLYKDLDVIQEKKDKLYDLISKVKPTDSVNRQLLRSLSIQVKPRPDDSEWRRLRATQMFADVMCPSIAMSGPVLAVILLVADKAARTLDKEKREAAAAKEESDHA